MNRKEEKRNEEIGLVVGGSRIASLSKITRHLK